MGGNHDDSLSFSALSASLRWRFAPKSNTPAILCRIERTPRLSYNAPHSAVHRSMTLKATRCHQASTLSMPSERNGSATNDLGPGRALLVGVELRGSHALFSAGDSLDELALLAHTAGVQVVGRAVQRVARIDPATFIGSGKLEEIAETLAETGANMIIFDDELSPRHQRELEKALGEHVQVLDRSALILDIFAQHARTREGALQVELAQYEYRLPRLTRQ
ncbi:MAG: hypothetical protein HRF48_02065, partial [Chloroflexota bacterium]